MTIRYRATSGAIAFFGGLLLAVGAMVTRSDASLQYEIDQKKHEADPGRVPEPAPPRTPVATGVMVVGFLAALAGPVLLLGAIRDMTRDIEAAQSRAETAMRQAVEAKREPKAKP